MTAEVEWIVPAMMPDGCIVETRGMLIGLWLTALRGEHFAAIDRALTDASQRYPRGVTTLSVYRLDPRFPLKIGYADTVNEALQTLRAVRHVVNASASVIEFGGMIGMVARAAIAGLNTFVRPKPTLAAFDTVPDALQWLLPQTPEADAPDSLAHYLRLVRRMGEQLQNDAVVDKGERAAR